MSIGKEIRGAIIGVPIRPAYLNAYWRFEPKVIVDRQIGRMPDLIADADSAG